MVQPCNHNPEPNTAADSAKSTQQEPAATISGNPTEDTNSPTSKKPAENAAANPSSHTLKQESAATTASSSHNPPPHTPGAGFSREKGPKTAQPPRGLASLFETKEIKELFRTYLVIMCVIEGFIFFVNFMTQLGPESVPFPWKSYFFAAFSIPLAITFLLGIIVISFDRYIFGHQGLGDGADDFFQAAAETRSRIHKLHAFLYVIRQAPFLIGLLILVALSAIAYKLDVILAVIGQVGERTAHYIFVGLAVIFAVGVVVGLIWIFLNYSLRKKAMEFEYQYKKDVVEKTGLVFVGGNRMMDNQGRMISLSQAQQLTHQPNDGDDPPALVIEPEQDT
jgi:hypothetical protein